MARVFEAVQNASRLEKGMGALTIGALVVGGANLYYDIAKDDNAVPSVMEINLLHEMRQGSFEDTGYWAAPSGSALLPVSYDVRQELLEQTGVGAVSGPGIACSKESSEYAIEDDALLYLQAGDINAVVELSPEAEQENPVHMTMPIGQSLPFYDDRYTVAESAAGPIYNQSEAYLTSGDKVLELQTEPDSENDFVGVTFMDPQPLIDGSYQYANIHVRSFTNQVSSNSSELVISSELVVEHGACVVSESPAD